MPRYAAAPDVIWVTKNEAVVTLGGRRFRVSGNEARGYVFCELSTAMMEHGRPIVIGRSFDRASSIATAVATIEGVVRRGDRLPRDRSEPWQIGRPRFDSRDASRAGLA